MDPQRLARLLDSRSALADGHPAGGLAVWPSEELRATARSRGVLISGTPTAPLAPELVGLELAAIELPAAHPAEPAGDGSAADVDGSPEQVVTEMAAGRWWSRRRRPSVVATAALLGAVSLGGLLTSGGVTAHAAAPATTEATSVAEELGLLRAQASALSEDEAAGRLQEMVASRAQREDAKVAAAQTQAAAEQAAIDAAAAAAAEAARPKVVLPVAGARLTSGFGARWGTLHAGIDLAAPMHTPEYAAMDGVVIKAGAASGYGLAVYIQHQNGDVTVYGHMDSILVAEGQVVRAGDTIALLGNRGQSTGPHLHFEVHVGGMDGTKIDPVGWLREHGVHI
ncbi:M23 family metallopeptidase [Modestobacter lapidis]|nr:M23 family metallopeptidase [Modestobacter lapidis]